MGSITKIYCLLEKEKPKVLGNKKGNEEKIFEKCSGEVWNTAEGAINEDAEIEIDMECPFKLEEIQIINGVGDFSTKRFSVFGSLDSSRWTWLYSGELQEGGFEVS